MAKERAAHYEVLGVDPAASMDEIRRSYLRLARTAHPDFHNGSDGERRSAEERMRAINAAWAVLGDVDARSSYDRDRLRDRPSASGDPRPHSRGHGSHRIDSEPDPWTPFDGGPTAGFDERDDRPITGSQLPSWMKTAPALGVLFGLAALILGSLIGFGGMARIGMLVVLVSLMLFLAAPLLALSLSRRDDPNP